ncbi:hypothetical protein QA639_34680 [Bradyrhizobium pachyrhizi]|uniref:hypothetical protein n=1 Tax=Bradyrhizobium pachyrhizi TaxID=280333 RepID=UPI0024B215AA|nr:hypothetical protein [Bradyrhizobium pachyrhizi]WFU54690.1 hypothetical protein QA639_34680 [Bradyrhizobium pachyrhizi]
MHTDVCIKQVNEFALIFQHPMTVGLMCQEDISSCWCRISLRWKARTNYMTGSAARVPRSPQSAPSATSNAARECCTQIEPAWSTVLEAISRAGRAGTADAVRPVRAPAARWSVENAGAKDIFKQDLSKRDLCGNRPSASAHFCAGATPGRRSRGRQPRSRSGTDQSIFKEQSKLERDAVARRWF